MMKNPGCFGNYILERSLERSCFTCRHKNACINGIIDRASFSDNPSDGSTASYYELPEGATELQDIISFLNCNAQMGEIGRAWMRYGRCPHSPKIRDIKKIIFYAQAELDRLEKYEDKKTISINVASAAMSKEQIEEAIKNIINDQHGVSNEKN